MKNSILNVNCAVKNFPAEPNSVIETINQEELGDLEDWQKENWKDVETGEVMIICPECFNNLEEYGDFMTLSKIIIECFINNLTLSELREFKRTVLIPQGASTLIKHLTEAEKILAQSDTSPFLKAKEQTIKHAKA